MNEALVIIPTYNERENVRQITDALLASSSEVDILFVDDNSPDGTGEIADQLASQNDRVNIVHRRDKQGLGKAYIAGFNWALERDYQYVMEMDADFSHNPADVPRLLEAAKGGTDLVLGSRYIGGIRVINWPLNRLILSRGAGLYVKIITGMPFSDPTGGFKCFRRKVLEQIDLERIRSNGYSFQIEMTHHAWMRGLNIIEVPITFEERRSGDSKMSRAIIREALWMVWKLLFRAGLRRKPHKPPRETSG